MTEEEKVMISMFIDRKTLNELTEIARQSNKTRSELIRNLLRQGLEQLATNNETVQPK